MPWIDHDLKAVAARDLALFAIDTAKTPAANRSRSNNVPPYAQGYGCALARVEVRSRLAIYVKPQETAGSDHANVADNRNRTRRICLGAKVK